MSRRKITLVAACLMIVAVLVTGRIRVELDAIVAPFRDDFREMVYLPKGDAMKLVAVGFDAPMADALFVKGLLYFSDSLKASTNRTTRGRYTFELFDVITELSPRFTRAYQMGAIFLTASGEFDNKLKGCRLLEKGIEDYTKMAAAGQPVMPDARWLFHAMLANTYDVSIQAEMRRRGDLEGAAQARQRAAQEYRLGASSPGSPPYMALAASGYESMLSGAGDILSSLQASLAVWSELYNDAAGRGDKDVLPDMENQIDDLQKKIKSIEDARQVEKILGDAGKKFLAEEKRPPVGVADLIAQKLIPGRPADTFGDPKHPDQYLALPDGSFKSRILANMESQNDMDLLLSAIIGYRRANNAPPPNPQALIDEKFLQYIPDPPLKALGQAYDYDPATGLFDNMMPAGPELPPDMQ